jgi:L-arabinokinase
MLEAVTESDGVLPSELREDLLTVGSEASRPWFVGCAPGRLDVMGGISDYCGGLAMGLTTGRGVWLAAQRRNDGQLCVSFAGRPGGSSRRTSNWALSNLHDGNQVRRAADFAARIARLGDEWVLPQAGVLHGLLALGHLSELGGGLTLTYRSELSAPSGLGAVAAAQIVLLEVLGEMFGFELDPEQLAEVCRHASREVCNLPSGNMDPHIALTGCAGALSLVNGDRSGDIPVPGAISFVGVDSGVTHRLAGEKRRQTRTAAAMGARIIDAVSADATIGRSSIGLCLAGISPEDYVSTYRDRLPTRMRGAEFLDLYGALETDADPVQPEIIYKVRSRTEHHIYENRRCRQFADLMRRTAQMPHAHWLESAGQLMYSSHWSYGQRCGLGTIETDLLVNLLQDCGVEGGILGARISGAGAGGMVVVMASASDRARENIVEVVAEYEARTGRRATLYEPGGTGARRRGVQGVGLSGA